MPTSGAKVSARKAVAAIRAAPPTIAEALATEWSTVGVYGKFFDCYLTVVNMPSVARVFSTCLMTPGLFTGLSEAKGAKVDPA